MTIKITAIENLFNNYLDAFKSYNVDGVVNCYHLPCTLNTPDKVVLIKTQEDCQQEFTDIFTQLKQANTGNIIASKASYLAINENLLLACVNWDFIDEQEQVFADFCAYYHIQKFDDPKQSLKIINVSSHELTNSQTLTTPFSIGNR